MTAAWPGSLPQFPLLNGASLIPIEQRVENPMELGLAKIRVRYTAEYFDFPARLLFVSQSQIDDFDDFYRDDLINGTQKFLWTDPRTQQTVKMQFVSRRWSPLSNKAGQWILDCQLRIGG